jgi:septal ring factor EnvC (AmiA/AmiB activator)
MREASQRLRDLVGDLREAAGRILAAAGTRADAHLDEIEQTIFAAAVDPQHHDTLRRGVLAAVLPGPGFGGLGLGLAVLPDPPEQDDDTAADAAYDETAEGLAAAAEAEEAHAAAVAERTKQRRAVQRRIDALEAARDKQAERAATAREEADGLRVRADAAADAAAAAEADLAEYDDDLAAARADLAALGDA